MVSLSLDENTGFRPDIARFGSSKLATRQGLFVAEDSVGVTSLPRRHALCPEHGRRRKKPEFLAVSPPYLLY